MLLLLPQQPWRTGRDYPGHGEGGPGWFPGARTWWDGSSPATFRCFPVSNQTKKPLKINKCFAVSQPCCQHLLCSRGLGHDPEGTSTPAQIPSSHQGGISTENMFIPEKSSFQLHLLQQCPQQGPSWPGWGQQRDTGPFCCFLGLKC